MKKIVILFVLICVQVNTFSQEIVKSWNITRYDEDSSPKHPYPTWTYYGLRTGSDTMINEKSYKKLFYSTDSLFQETFNFGGIREELNCIYLSKYSLNEYLLYDFNLNQGDSVSVYRYIDKNLSSIEPITAIVDSVDMIQINGENRKRLYIEDKCIDSWRTNKDIWVQGIGSIKYGLLNEACRCYIGCYIRPYLTCYSENNSIIWRDLTFQSCYIDSSNSNNITQEIILENEPSIRILNGQIQIHSEELLSSIRVINLLGQTILLKNEINGKYYEFSLKNSEKGLYILISNNKHTNKIMIF